MMPGRITGPMPERIIEYLGACGRFCTIKWAKRRDEDAFSPF